MQSRLEQMSRRVIFEVGDTGDGVNGYCRRSNIADGFLGPGLNGTGSTIRLSRDTYHGLLQSQENPGDIVNQQWAAFHLAITIVHELGHAAMNATLTIDLILGANVFVGETAQTIEVGFELESWLFDGVTLERLPLSERLYVDGDSCQSSALTGMLVAVQYPCAAKSRSYHACRMAHQDNDQSLQTIWNVSFLHIHQMFRDDSWRHKYRKLGRGALAVERKTAYQFAFEGWWLCSCYSTSGR